MKKTTIKLFSLLIVAVMVCSVFIGCTAKEEAPKDDGEVGASDSADTATQDKDNNGELTKIRVGTQPTTIGVPAQYALEKGYFKEEGLDVDLVLFPTGAPLNEAIAAGELDVAANGLASVFPLANGVCEWIGEANTTGGMGIYVREGSPILENKGEIEGKPDMYGTAESIKGTTFLGPIGTSAQFNVMRYIQHFGLSDADIEQIHMDHGQAYQAYVAGEGDALATSPPFSYDAEDSGFIMAASFEDATESPLFDGLLARKDYSADNPESVKAFVKAYYRACEDLMSDPEMRKEYSIDWFTKNGREYNEETMLKEIADRDYVTQSMMESEDYSYGLGMLAIADFYTFDGKVEEADLPNVPESFNVSYIEEIMDIEINIATYDDLK